MDMELTQFHSVILIAIESAQFHIVVLPEKFPLIHICSYLIRRPKLLMQIVGIVLQGTTCGFDDTLENQIEMQF